MEGEEVCGLAGQMVLPLLRKSGVWVSRYLYLKETTSTNDVAKELARAGLPEIGLIVADRQTLGRGRQGRRWVSESGNGLWFSLVLRPRLAFADSGLLAIASALAVDAAVRREFSLKGVTLKWPNDVMVRGRKLAGILVEAGGGRQMDWAVVGIGINTTENIHRLADVNRPVASIGVETGSPVCRVRLLVSLMGCLANIYRRLQFDRDDILSRFAQRCETVGQRICWTDGEGTKTGTAFALDASGALLVRVPGIRTPVRLVASEVSLC